MEFFYEWGIPLIVLLVWIAAIFIVVPPIVNRLRIKAEEKQHYFNSIVLSALGTPLALFLLVIGLKLFIDTAPALPAIWQKYINALFLILSVSAGYLFLDQLMIRTLRRYSKTVDVIASSAGVIRTLYRGVILLFAAIIILDRLGITITPFLASLGIGGLVVALALQDTFANFFSGLYLFLDKPVMIGDYVKLESGDEGYVRQVGWHSTRIQLLSNNMVIVSNSKLAGSRITNYYLPNQEIAVLVNVGVAYESDLEKVEKITVETAREVLRETDGGVKEFEPFIRYNNFGESAVNFTVILRAKEYTHQYLIVHEFIKRLHRRYEREGIEIPYPIRNVYMRNTASKTANPDDLEKADDKSG
jgi:small-conductance mechanosensitive channel